MALSINILSLQWLWWVDGYKQVGMSFQLLDTSSAGNEWRVHGVYTAFLPLYYNTRLSRYYTQCLAFSSTITKHNSVHCNSCYQQVLYCHKQRSQPCHSTTAQVLHTSLPPQPNATAVALARLWPHCLKLHATTYFGAHGFQWMVCHISYHVHRNTSNLHLVELQ